MQLWVITTICCINEYNSEPLLHALWNQIPASVNHLLVELVIYDVGNKICKLPTGYIGNVE